MGIIPQSKLRLYVEYGFFRTYRGKDGSAAVYGISEWAPSKNRMVEEIQAELGLKETGRLDAITRKAIEKALNSDRRIAPNSKLVDWLMTSGNLFKNIDGDFVISSRLGSKRQRAELSRQIETLAAENGLAGAREGMGASGTASTYIERCASERKIAYFDMVKYISESTGLSSALSTGQAYHAMANGVSSTVLIDYDYGSKRDMTSDTLQLDCSGYTLAQQRFAGKIPGFAVGSISKNRHSTYIFIEQFQNLPNVNPLAKTVIHGAKSVDGIKPGQKITIRSAKQGRGKQPILETEHTVREVEVKRPGYAVVRTDRGELIATETETGVIAGEKMNAPKTSGMVKREGKPAITHLAENEYSRLNNLASQKDLLDKRQVYYVFMNSEGEKDNHIGTMYYAKAEIAQIDVSRLPLDPEYCGKVMGVLSKYAGIETGRGLQVRISKRKGEATPVLEMRWNAGRGGERYAEMQIVERGGKRCIEIRGQNGKTAGVYEITKENGADLTLSYESWWVRENSRHDRIYGVREKSTENLTPLNMNRFVTRNRKYEGDYYVVRQDIFFDQRKYRTDIAGKKQAAQRPLKQSEPAEEQYAKPAKPMLERRIARL